MDYKNPHLVVESDKIEPGSVTWKSPSNLAIIKYWGKHGLQLPRNPSISLTLDHAHTQTKLAYEPRSDSKPEIILELFLDGEPNAAFAQKVKGFLESIVDIYPFLRQLSFKIDTSNSFPHSAGIASSASGMSALALCLCSLERRFFSTLKNEVDFLQKASYLARLGSGSACRSVYPYMAAWGESTLIEHSSDLYAVPFQQSMHEVFRTYHDDILIVSKEEKSVSSRIGHELMENNPYAANRYQQAKHRLHLLVDALKDGDVETFGQIAENEALTLHALMMTSHPSYVLMKPNSLLLIEKVRAYRETSGQPLFFSLDAGPNLHLLYPHSIASDVKAFINKELLQYCVNKQCIQDQAGAGPKEIKAGNSWFSLFKKK
jgi:diphosphomevalonate decarboxylase